jgi:hypothetical protein
MNNAYKIETRCTFDDGNHRCDQREGHKGGHKLEGRTLLGFVVYADTVNGDLLADRGGARMLNREQAWKAVQHWKKDTSVKAIRVHRGCDLKWSSARIGEEWTR